MTRTIAAGCMIGLSLLTGCDRPPPVSAPDDFVLPAGDAERGRETFLRMRCYDCHRIPGVELPVAEEPNQVLVELGGDVTKVQSYSDLVTSIINPSHKLAAGYTRELVTHDGESNMTNYNQVMTVAQLCDLVTYLETQYKVVPERSP